MLVNNTVKIVSLSALTLVLSACEPAVQPKVQPKVQSKLVSAERYADNGDGTVTDIQTNLTWQRCSVGQTWTGETCEGNAAIFKWDDAINLAEDGWRLPTVDELDTLVFCSSGQRKPSARPNSKYVSSTNGKCQGDYARPTINQLAFPNTPGGWFWSSSPYASGSNSAWGADFLGGSVDSPHKGNSNQVRLVRAGQ